jgi:hypothetical protein
MAVQTVKVRVDGGPSIDVPWVPGMTGEDALKKAYDLFHGQTPNSFSYAVTYYGQQLGYLVSMINETYDSFNSKLAPFFYWEIYYNNYPASVGVDSLKLNVGDDLRFSFETYNAATHTQSTLAAKNAAQVNS